MFDVCVFYVLDLGRYCDLQVVDVILQCTYVDVAYAVCVYQSFKVGEVFGDLCLPWLS